MSVIDDFCSSIQNGRCNHCKYGKVVTAYDGYMFFGCYHRPYTGKRVAEIKDCPKGCENYESNSERD